MFNRFKFWLRRSRNRRHIFSFLSVAVLTAGLVVVVNQVQKLQDLRTEAAPSGVELYLSPSDNTIQPGESVLLQVLISTDANQPHEVTAVEVHLEYDPLVAEITGFNLDGSSPFTTILSAPDYDNNTGTASFIVAMPPADPPAGYSGSTFIADLTIVGVAEGGGNVSFASGTQVAALGHDGDVADDTLDGAVVTVQTNTSAPTLKLSTFSESDPQEVGREFTTSILFDTAGEPIEAVDVGISFDNNLLEVVSITEPTTPSLPLYQYIDYDNLAGTINVSASIPVPTEASQPIVGENIELALVTFRPKVVSSGASISFIFDDPPASPPNTNDSNMIKPNPDGDPIDVLARVENVSVEVVVGGATPVPTPTATPVPTPTAIPGPTDSPVPTPTAIPGPTDSPVPTTTPTPSQSNSLKIGFQGKRDDFDLSGIPITVSIVNSLGAPVACNDLGHIKCDTAITTPSGQFNLTLEPGNYTSLIKSPGYLARKYLLNITSGTTNYDLTGYPLLSGDLNNDGVVNDFDYTTFVGKFLRSDSMVDLDGSGVINDYDFSLMRPNWFEVDDEF